MLRLLKVKIVMPKVLGSTDFVFIKASGKQVVTNSHKIMAKVILRKGKSRIDEFDDEDIKTFLMADMVQFLIRYIEVWKRLIRCCDGPEFNQSCLCVRRAREPSILVCDKFV